MDSGDFCALLEESDFLLSWQKEKLLARVRACNGSKPSVDEVTMAYDAMMSAQQSHLDRDQARTTVDYVLRRLIGSGIRDLGPMEAKEVEYALQEVVP